MKLSDAWRIVAIEHDAGRTESQFLCIVLDRTFPSNAAVAAIPIQMRLRMKRRICRALGNGRHAAYTLDVPSDEARAARVLACLMFAAEAESEDAESGVRA